MELSKIKALIALVSESRISELEIVESGERIRIVKAQSTEPMTATRRPSPITGRKTADRQEAAGVDARIEAPPAETFILAPMFGVFHGSPAPDAAPFVQLGQRVEIGQPICIVEAMKTFNMVHSDAAGMLAEALVESGQEIEAGQPLFRIDP